LQVSTTSVSKTVSGCSVIVMTTSIKRKNESNIILSLKPAVLKSQLNTDDYSKGSVRT
jgi:hypothetical protein